MGRERVARRRTVTVLVPALALAMALAVGATAQAAPPTVGLSASPSTARVGQSVAFHATASGADGATISSLAWSFGDGTGGSGADVSHAYGSTGAKTVTVTATDSNNETATASGTVQVIGDPSASFSFAPGVPNIGDAVAFDATASSDPGGSIASYAWNFGDGATGSGAKPSHSYATSGDKTVTLTITASLDGRTASTTRTVHVNVPPNASFVFAGVDAPDGQDPFTPVIGQQVAFSAQGSSDPDGSIASYAWDLGTGTFGAPQSQPWLINTFNKAGPTTVRVRVTDNRGATAIATAQFRVNTPPVAGFDLDPTAPETGQAVTFTSTASDGDGASDIASISWDLNGDGTYGDVTGPKAMATFLSAGRYTVGEKVTDKGGASATTTRTVDVSGPPAPPPPATGSGPGSGTGTTVVSSPGAPIADGGAAPARGGPSATTSGTSVATTSVALRGLRGARVQLAGSVTARRTQITRIVVFGPSGATVIARCRGTARGCPSKPLRLRLPAAGHVRLKAMERSLRAGARIEISISKSGYATKRIILTMRAGKAPKRTEGCLVPGKDGKLEVGRCPAS